MVTFRRPRTDPRHSMLSVWTNGERVGVWSVQDSEHRFQYDDAWPNATAGRWLSLSLPFTPDNVPHRGEVVRNWFDNCCRLTTRLTGLTVLRPSRWQLRVLNR